MVLKYTFLKYALKCTFFSNFLEKFQILGLEQEMYEMSLKHLIIPDSEDTITNYYGHVKGAKNQLEETFPGQQWGNLNFKNDNNYKY